MPLQAIYAISPIIITATAAVVVMLGISIYRDHRLTVVLTVLGFIAAIIALPCVYELIPIQATPLIIVDHYSIFFSGLILLTGIVVALLCYAYFVDDEAENEELYLLLITAVLGAVVLVCSRHFATFFLGLETLSVSLFAMIAYTLKNALSLEAGLKYIVLSGVSSAFILFGAALIYAELGTFVFADMAMLAAIIKPTSLVIVGLAMIVAGLAFKLSLVPFHLWTSDVYEGAPAPVTAFVATVSKGAIFALLLRYFTTSDAFDYYPVVLIFTLLAVLSIVIGNLLALQQKNLKRLLAYSSIAHMGYLLIPFVAGASMDRELVVEAAAFYLVAYFITTLGAFGIIAVASESNKEIQLIDEYQGWMWKKPVMAFVLTAMLMSLAGIPLTAGFIGKFYVFAAGLDAALWLLVMVLVVGSGIGLYYYLRVVLVMLEKPESTLLTSDQRGKLPNVGQATVMALAVLLVYLGVFPGALTDLIHDMARIFSV